MKYLIINLSRFGDILQSQVLVSELKSSGHQVAMLTLENFVDSCDFISELDYKYAFKSSELLEKIDKRDWQQAFNALQSSCTKILNEFMPDYILNITPILSARLLALNLQNLLEQKGQKIELLGFGLDKHGFALNSNIWATYMLVVSLNRSHSSMNLVDVFCKASSVVSKDKKYQLKKSRGAIQDILPELYLKKGLSDTLLVAIQLGASNPARAYDTSSFAKVSNILYEHGYTPVLLGVKSEEKYATMFYQAGGIAINLIGQTNTQELATVLQNIQVLLTNDTGTMHLAAGLGTPIIAIFLATAQVFDTAPYLLDALLLEANLACHPCEFSQKCSQNHACQKYISPEYIAELVMAKLENKALPIDPQARLFINYQDDYSFMRQKRLDKLNYEHREAWIEIQYRSYRQFLDFIDLARQNLKLTDFVKLDPKLSQSLDHVIKTSILDCLRQSIQVLELLIMQGNLIQQKPQLASAFLDNNQRISNILGENKELSLLASLWKTTGQELATDLSNFLDFSSKIKVFLEYLQENLS